MKSASIQTVYCGLIAGQILVNLLVDSTYSRDGVYGSRLPPHSRAVAAVERYERHRDGKGDSNEQNWYFVSTSTFNAKRIQIWCLPRPLYAHPSVMAIDVCARGIPTSLRLVRPLTFAYSLGVRELRNAAVSQTSHAL